MMRQRYIAIAFLALLTSCTSATMLSREETVAGVKAALERQDFSIRVERATPLGGRSVNLTSYYTIDVHPNEVQAYLPYFGRTTGVATYGGVGAVQLRTSQFKYQQLPTRYGWQVTIVPEASDDVREVNMEISSSGNVTAKFSFKNRTPVDYWGFVNLSKLKIDSSAFRN